MLAIIKLVQSLPNNSLCRVIEYQLSKSATSVGANYRAACRAKSTADFIYKIGVVEEEAYETQFWLEFIIESKLLKKEQVTPLLS